MQSHLPPPSTLPPGSTVWAYLRDSGGPRQDQSVEQQRTVIADYCQRHGLRLAKIFADVAVSGASTAGRDQFNAMIDLTRRVEDRPTAVLLWNYARFARDLDDSIYYKALLRNRRILIHSLTDPVPEGQYGRIVEFFIDISNEEKRRQTSADAKRGLHSLVREHGCVPGTPPRGFVRVPVELGQRRDGSAHTAHRWEPDPEMIPLVRRAFRMKAAGATLAQIHAETHLYGSLNSYRGFFSNRIYLGILEYGGMVIENYCEPVIDMQTWNAVQARLDAHSQGKRIHPRRVNSPYLLSGLVYCGHCGAPMNGNTVTRTARGRSEAYRCSRAKRRRDCPAGRISRRLLETAVLDTIENYILLPENVDAMHHMAMEYQHEFETERSNRRTALQKTKRKLSLQIANLTRAIAESGHSQALLEKLARLEASRAQIIAELDELKTPVQPLPDFSPEQIETLARGLTETLVSAPAEQARTILRGFIHKIVAKKENGAITGAITYYYPPPFELPPKTGGDNLPIGSSPLGAPFYRQIHAHPIVSPPD